MGSSGHVWENFGQLVRRVRNAAGLTQEELAVRSGLGVRTISDIERGRTSRPRMATVNLLAHYLGLTDPLAAVRADAQDAGPAVAAARSAEAAPG
jgi:transcriptional regulator with XRE-family HTH domain